MPRPPIEKQRLSKKGRTTYTFSQLPFLSAHAINSGKRRNNPKLSQVGNRVQPVPVQLWFNGIGGTTDSAMFGSLRSYSPRTPLGCNWFRKPQPRVSHKTLHPGLHSRHASGVSCRRHARILAPGTRSLRTRGKHFEARNAPRRGCEDQRHPLKSCNARSKLRGNFYCIDQENRRALRVLMSGSR